MNISIVEKDLSEIGVIKPLWEGLNSVHIEKSVYFKERYKKFTFEKRMEAIYEKAKRGILKIDLLLNNDTGSYVGYCISSIEGSLGEIDSIFIDGNYRKYGLGDRLMKSALGWFEANGITNIQINVAYANDEALPFYAHYGFQIGGYILRKSEELIEN